MSTPDLIQQQREILRAFHQANAQRAQAEADAKALYKTDREDATTDLEQARRQANRLIDQSQKAQGQANAVLVEAGLKNLLEQTESISSTVQHGEDLSLQLSQCVSTVVESSRNLINQVRSALVPGGE